MDKFFRSFLEMKWKIKGEWVSFLDALLFVAITGSSLIMRLALMWGFTGWFWLVDYVAAADSASAAAVVIFFMVRSPFIALVSPGGLPGVVGRGRFV